MLGKKKGGKFPSVINAFYLQGYFKEVEEIRKEAESGQRPNKVSGKRPRHGRYTACIVWSRTFLSQRWKLNFSYTLSSILDSRALPFCAWLTAGRRREGVYDVIEPRGCGVENVFHHACMSVRITHASQRAWLELVEVQNGKVHLISQSMTTRVIITSNSVQKPKSPG